MIVDGFISSMGPSQGWESATLKNPKTLNPKLIPASSVRRSTRVDLN